MEKEIVKLTYPITVEGSEISELTLRPSRVGDEEDAMQMAVRLKKADNPVTVEVLLFSHLTKLPYDAIRLLHGQDYQKLRQTLNRLNGVEAAENPIPASME